MMTTVVDVILPCYNEDPVAIEATVLSLLTQTHPVAQVILVDDCSTISVDVSRIKDKRVHVVRMDRNSGISAARNEGLRRVTAPLVACINIEILPRTDWMEQCCHYIVGHSDVGAVGTRVLPNGTSLPTRWRMRYQERPYPEASGPVDWAAGHALLFRTSALRQIGGFDTNMRKAGEDVDVCFRLSAAGWVVHFVAETECASIQVDTIQVLAKAEFNRFSWRADKGNGFLRCLAIATSRGIQRSLRHLIFFRWQFLPVELRLWCHGVGLAWRNR
jgi:cellulose synthase/poly-beta-1,6-N-acetylglucosamine synthase-like glycosyltransferase